MTHIPNFQHEFSHFLHDRLYTSWIRQNTIMMAH